MSALTKILIVLQLVFSLVCAVLLVLFISRTEDLRKTNAGLATQNYALGAQVTNLQKDVASANGQTTESARQVADAVAARSAAEQAKAKAEEEAAKNIAGLKNEVADLTGRNATLTATNAMQEATIKANNVELAAQRDQVPTLVKQNAELIRAKTEVDNQLHAAELSINKLQELLAQNSGKGNGSASLNLGNQVRQLDSKISSGKINGTVSEVAMSAGRMRIGMPLGSRDGIQVGTRMYVYRANGYVGDVTVETVTPEESVAVVVSTKAGETVQKGDFVSTTGN